MGTQFALPKASMMERNRNAILAPIVTRACMTVTLRLTSTPASREREMDEYLAFWHGSSGRSGSGGRRGRHRGAFTGPEEVAFYSAMSLFLVGIPLSIALAVGTSLLGAVVDYPLALANAITFYLVPLAIYTFLLSRIAPYKSRSVKWRIALGWPGEFSVLIVVSVICFLVY